nr:hypothetical protein [Tanacetum cinerariifolium]
MANRENSTTSEDWRRKTLRFGLDEFCGRKVIVSIQQNYWKTRSRKLQAVPLTAHIMLKIPVEGGVITLKSSRLVALECALVFGPEETPPAPKPMVEERIKVAINPEYPEQTIMIGFTLTEEGHNKLCNLLQRNLDIFAWKPMNMTGVPRHIAEHRLNIREGCTPVKQKVEEGMFLGYKVNTKGLKVCPDKVDAVLSLSSPKCLKDVQKLNEKVVSLNKFLAKSAEKSLPFFKTLKKYTKKSDFHWTAKAEEAFKQMKQLIAELPMLTAPTEKEELIVYLAAAKETVSAVLMMKRKAKQMPIYFVSRALRGPELNYTSMEKPRVSVKGQILADFIVERPEEGSSNTLMEVEEELPEPWILFTDGSFYTDGSEAGLILTNPEGVEFTYALRFRFDATNNEAEYEALIFGLRITEQMGQVLVEELKEKSIREVEILAVVEEEGDTWMTPIFKYLEEGTLPADVKKVRAVRRPGKVKFLIVAIDYFTKWIEAKPVATITENQIKKYVGQHRLQIRTPRRDYLGQGKTTNGLVERANRSLGKGIKAWLDARSKNWMEELPHVLWAHRTMIKSSNEDTSFSLTYETEAVIPTGIGKPTLKTAEVDLVQNNEALEINLELLEERREEAAIREAKSRSGTFLDRERISRVQTRRKTVLSLILVSPRKEYDNFVPNYNMHSMGKTVTELHAILKLHEETLPPKEAAPALQAIRAGRVQKNQKKKLHKTAKGNQGKAKAKMGNALVPAPFFAPKPKNHPIPKKDNPAKNAICHQYGKVGHWRRNCSVYLAELLKKEEGLRGSKKLKQRALSLYVGDGHHATVKAIENFTYVSLDGFVNRFEKDNSVLVSRNNLVYFCGILRNDIYEIDLSSSNTNDSSMYAVSNKRAKLNLDSTLLCHCRLGHISKKRIEKLQHDELLNSTDIKSFEKCVSCMFGKMARKPYSHQEERAKDLLGLIHTDVCGSFRTVSRQGASYFVTFTDDFSGYGYVYLLKHKHEVFETFKVFHKEVENQLRKTIKSLRSYCRGEYMSQAFLDHLKEHGIIAHRTPPHMPQHNGVSERKNKTLLDMVHSMMSQTTLPKSFWNYALESAVRILNMVLTNKVEKTPYKVWHGQALKLSYLKVWGCESLVKRDTLTKPEKLEPISIKCIFVGYPKETVGYSFYYPPENKVFVARNAEFFENNTSLNHEEDDQEIDEPQSDINPIPKSSRKRRASDRMCLHVDAEEHELGDLGELANYKVVLLDPESDKWLNAMNVEMQSMRDNEVWDSSGSKTLHLNPGIDYEETFSPVADIRAIRILIPIALFYDYEICWINLGELHWTTVKNILKYLRNTKDMFLLYGGDTKRELKVSCYNDAGYLTDADDLKSQTGYVFILNGGAVD